MVATNRIDEQEGLLRLASVKILAMDVDGVLTDGGFLIGEDGIEQKRFHVSDGLGLVALRSLGTQVVWVSGRRSRAVDRRAEELKIPFVFQGVRNKASALRQLIETQAFEAQTLAFLGDDWNDLLAFEVVGVRIAVADAAAEVRDAADFVTLRAGGQGAVREVCEALMDAQNRRRECLKIYLDSLRSGDVEAIPH